MNFKQPSVLRVPWWAASRLLCLLIVGLVAGVPAHAQTFDPTGSMMEARYDHQATLLNNGKVLITGGFSIDYRPLTSAELYNPATDRLTAAGNMVTGRFRRSTGRFTAAGNMVTGRFRHSATLLSNGKVLIAGGDSHTLSGALVSAEIYDPTTGTFSKTGDMTTPRFEHTATLLPNGKVLFAGGRQKIESPTTLSAAELFDPLTGTFSATGSLATARLYHTATLLPGGKVLIAGGEPITALPVAPSTAELYDPATGTFSLTGRMVAEHRNHTATLLPNGKVLFAGGDASTAELYDPMTGTFTTTGRLTMRRHGKATLLDNGKVLITGEVPIGLQIGNQTVKSGDLYDPVTGTFAATGNMVKGRFSDTATLLPNGKVLIAGGAAHAAGQFSDAELYSPLDTLTVSIAPAIPAETYSDTFSEAAGAGATRLRIARNGSAQSDLTVSLSSTDTSEVGIQSSVTIPAGAVSVLVSVDAFDDLFADGTQNVQINGTASGYEFKPIALKVIDNERAALTATLWPTSFYEPRGGTGPLLRVSHNRESTAPVVVGLVKTNARLNVPSLVIIPGGKREVAVPLTITAADPALIGTRTALITASAPGFNEARVRAFIFDARKRNRPGRGSGLYQAGPAKKSTGPPAARSASQVPKSDQAGPKSNKAAGSALTPVGKKAPAAAPPAMSRSTAPSASNPPAP